MSKFLYGIISRNVDQSGIDGDKGYDDYDPIFEDDGNPQLRYFTFYVTQRIKCNKEIYVLITSFPSVSLCCT